MLTDGTNEEIAFNFYPAPDVNLSGIADREPRVVWNDPNDPRVDLHGQTVDEYTLRIDMLTIHPPAQGGFDARVTFSAISVPEPAGVMMIASQAALVIWRRGRG